MSYAREKIIRKIGDSSGIIFNREEREIYDLNIGEKIRIMIEKPKQGDKK
jgi:hypothetical protein